MQVDSGNLPVGIIVICGGFFLVYFIEELVHFISDRHAHNETDVSLHRTVGIRSCPVSLSSEPSAPCDSADYGAIPSHDIPHSCALDMKTEETRLTSRRTDPALPAAPLPAAPLPAAPLPAALLHNHHTAMIDSDPCVGAALRGLLVIMALSFHEILEGLAIGLQKEASGVWQLLVAVASHKYVISLCIGMELSTSRVSLLIYTVYILVFSFVTPFGTNLSKIFHL